MAPAPESTAAAAGRKRKKPHGPSKTLAKKRSDPKSTSVKKNKKEKHKHTTRKEKKPGPTGPHAKKPAEPDQATAAGDVAAGEGVLLSAAMPPAWQLEFFLRSFERAVKMRLSPLELDSYSEGCMVQLDEGSAQDVDSFGEHVKGAFGASWKEELCDGHVVEGEIGVGSPALLVISLAALRSLELLRGLKMFTKECRPVKLFAKHLKVEEQVCIFSAMKSSCSLLKAPSGSKEFRRNFIGIHSFGKVGQNAVWNKGSFNSKTEESFLHPLISQERKHPLGTNGFAEARGNERRGERERRLLHRHRAIFSDLHNCSPFLPVFDLGSERGNRAAKSTSSSGRLSVLHLRWTTPALPEITQRGSVEEDSDGQQTDGGRR